jgi:hypothetical protein
MLSRVIQAARTHHCNAGLPKQGFFTSVKQNSRRRVSEPETILFRVILVCACEGINSAGFEAIQSRLNVTRKEKAEALMLIARKLQRRRGGRNSEQI